MKTSKKYDFIKMCSLLLVYVFMQLSFYDMPLVLSPYKLRFGTAVPVVVSTQKNRLDETVLFSTQNGALSYGKENIYNFRLKFFVYLNL